MDEEGDDAGSAETGSRQEIKNEGDIGQQFAINEVRKLYVRGGGGDDFPDPSDDFTTMDGEVAPFDNQEELKKHFELLHEHRIIVLDCLDENVSESAVYGLVGLYRQKIEFPVREILFEGKNKRRPDALSFGYVRRFQ